MKSQTIPISSVNYDYRFRYRWNKMEPTEKVFLKDKTMEMLARVCLLFQCFFIYHVYYDNISDHEFITIIAAPKINMLILNLNLSLRS